MKRLLCLLMMTVAVHAQANPAPTIAFDPNSIPTMYVNSKGEVAGIYPAIVKRAFELMQEPVALVALPFRRLLQGLSSNQVAAGSLVKTPERLRIGEFSAPYYVESVSVYYLAQSGLGFARLEDLHGHSVGVISGWAYGGAFDAAMASRLFRSESVSHDIRNFKKLKLDRIDFAVATTFSGKLLQTRPEFYAIESSPVQLTAIPIHLAFNRQAGRTDLLKRFDVAVATMRASGELEKIVASEWARALVESKLRQTDNGAGQNE